jgi:multicomponent Na+:H+ antiporter subunit E
MMNLKTLSRLIVFILSFLVWLSLTSFSDIQEITAGFFISIIVSLVAGHFLITILPGKNLFKKFMISVKYFFIFILEMIKANLHVAYIVIHPKLPIKPGIVKIKTLLTKDSARTVLADSITLTPGTMTVDINSETNEYYIHWIDIVSANPNDVNENTEKISSVFEKILKEIFE